MRHRRLLRKELSRQAWLETGIAAPAFPGLLATIIGACVLCPGTARAAGLLYQLPEDRSWVRFAGQYTFKLDRMEQAGSSR